MYTFSLEYVYIYIYIPPAVVVDMMFLFAGLCCFGVARFRLLMFLPILGCYEHGSLGGPAVDLWIPGWSGCGWGAPTSALTALAQRLSLDQLRSLRLDVFKESGNLPDRPRATRGLPRTHHMISMGPMPAKQHTCAAALVRRYLTHAYMHLQSHHVTKFLAYLAALDSLDCIRVKDRTVHSRQTE